jgi:hypothetical protein
MGAISAPTNQTGKEMTTYYEIIFTLADNTKLTTYGEDETAEFDKIVKSREEEGLETLPWKKVSKREIYG